MTETANIEGHRLPLKDCATASGEQNTLPLLQRWMGHSKQETRAIYMQAVGQEERELAGAVW